MTQLNVCHICKVEKPLSKLVPALTLKTSTYNEIKDDYPDWNDDCFICNKDFYKFVNKQMQEVLEEERGEINDLENEVVKSFEKHALLTKNIQQKFDSDLTFGQKISDKMASFGGSWSFLGVFVFILVGWVLYNSIFDPKFDLFPFILLNLILSCLAAVQAPVIMMSQNRQEAKDRLRSEHDYQTNLKAELEIRQLHDKIDHMISSQWERLVSIQQMQTELLTVISSELNGNGNGIKKEVKEQNIKRRKNENKRKNRNSN